MSAWRPESALVRLPPPTPLSLPPPPSLLLPSSILHFISIITFSFLLPPSVPRLTSSAASVPVRGLGARSYAVVCPARTVRPGARRGVLPARFVGAPPPSGRAPFRPRPRRLAGARRRAALRVPVFPGRWRLVTLPPGPRPRAAPVRAALCPRPGRARVAGALGALFGRPVGVVGAAPCPLHRLPRPLLARPSCPAVAGRWPRRGVCASPRPSGVRSARACAPRPSPCVLRGVPHPRSPSCLPLQLPCPHPLLRLLSRSFGAVPSAPAAPSRPGAPPRSRPRPLASPRTHPSLPRSLSTAVFSAHLSSFTTFSPPSQRPLQPSHLPAAFSSVRHRPQLPPALSLSPHVSPPTCFITISLFRPQRIPCSAASTARPPLQLLSPYPPSLPYSAAFVHTYSFITHNDFHDYPSFSFTPRILSPIPLLVTVNVREGRHMDLDRRSLLVATFLMAAMAGCEKSANGPAINPTTTKNPHPPIRTKHSYYRMTRSGSRRGATCRRRAAKWQCFTVISTSPDHI